MIPPEAFNHRERVRRALEELGQHQIVEPEPAVLSPHRGPALEQPVGPQLGLLDQRAAIGAMCL